ncbi:MAG: YIP1 family protein [Gemmatimonadaceae bacterium]|nr:YIP1 family protein [Gemmatimonadaceae bacterium]
MALVDRVKNILLSPRTEWQVIDAEPATVASLYTGYIIPLAAIPAICQALGMALIGYSIPFVGGHYRTPIVTALTSAVVMYCFTLVAVFIVALVVDGLAPTFGGTKNQVQALKVVAYSYTASWIGGILGLIPALSIIGILFGLYSLYLLFLGLPVLMKAPADKAVVYTVVVVVCTIIITWVIFFAVAAMGFGMGAGAMAGAGSPYRP